MSKYNHDCLLCNVDEHLPKVEERVMAYATIVDMARQAEADPWQQYANLCRRHAMQCVQAIAALNPMFLELSSAPSALRPALERMMKRQIARLESEIIAQYDKDETRKEAESS